MEKSTLIAIIAAIAVIAIAAAAAIVLTSNNGNNSSNSGDSGDDNNDSWEPKDYGSWEPSSTDVGLLTVFGNANGDSVINKDDLNLINKAYSVR